MTSQRPPPFFSLELPPRWRVQFGDHPMLIDGRTTDGGRLAVWASATTPASAEPSARREAVIIDLRRAGVRDPRLVDGMLGAEPALVALYDHDGRPHAQLSAAREGIEYRVSLVAPSPAERDAVLAELGRSFAYPTGDVAREVAATLPRAMTPQESAIAQVAAARAAGRAALGFDWQGGRRRPS